MPLAIIDRHGSPASLQDHLLLSRIQELPGSMLQMPPATSEQIAENAGLQERYVREWLGGMVVRGIVDYAPDQRTAGLSMASILATSESRLTKGRGVSRSRV